MFLIFKTVTLSSQLEEAQQKVTETQDLNEKYEQVQLEKMQLQEELDALQNPDGATAQETTEGNADDSETTTGDSTSGSDSNTSSSSSGSSSGTTEYTVQQGKHLGAWHRNSMAMALNIQRFWKQMAYRKAKISSPVMY